MVGIERGERGRRVWSESSNLNQSSSQHLLHALIAILLLYYFSIVLVLIVIKEFPIIAMEGPTVFPPTTFHRAAHTEGTFSHNEIRVLIKLTKAAHIEMDERGAGSNTKNLIQHLGCARFILVDIFI